MAIRFIESTPGTSLQRNRGLAEVATDVVLFPDDDSLLLPGAREHILRIYELDTEGIVGGVCSAEAQTAPREILATAEESYRMTPADRIRRAINRRLRRIVQRLFPDPFFYLAEKRYRALPVPDWLAAENAVLVPWMVGFRMSFRTEVVRAVGFDVALGRYALNEDLDASLRVPERFHIKWTHIPSF
jgi:GT2 family glycosyltransferase